MNVDAIRQRAALDQTANGMMDKDLRFTMLARSVAAQVTDDYQARTGHLARRAGSEEVHQIALAAAVLMLARVYTEDAELVALRAERDMFRDHYARLAALTPPQSPESWPAPREAQS